MGAHFHLHSLRGITLGLKLYHLCGSQVEFTGPGGNEFGRNRTKQNALFGALNALRDPDFKQVWPVDNIIQPELPMGSGRRHLLQTDVSHISCRT